VEEGPAQGYTPRFSQFDTFVPTTPTAAATSAVIEVDAGNTGDASGEPSLHNSGLHHSGRTLDSARRHNSGTAGLTERKNAFGSFMFSPALPTVGIGNPGMTISENPGLSGPLGPGLSGPIGPSMSGPIGTPRSDALTMDLTATIRQKRGMPTVSQAVEPGPYHKANARLRQQMPHYRARVNIKTRWDHILMTFLTLLTFIAYIGMRAWYLITGKAEDFRTQNISLKYSWVVLSAEVVLGLLLLYSNQLFWKQEIVYTMMGEEEVRQITEVRLSVALQDVPKRFHHISLHYTRFVAYDKGEATGNRSACRCFCLCF
jgi:hypothetical protein